MQTEHEDHANLQLVKGGNGPDAPMTYAEAHGDYVDWDGGSLFVIIECKAEEHVYAAACYTESSVLIAGHTTFVGYLLEISV